VKVTKHAEKRIKQRAGKKIDPDRFAEHAVTRGLKHRELKGNLKKWVDGKVLRSQYKPIPYVYDNQLFLFQEENLVTIIPLPSNLNKLVAQITREKNSLTVPPPVNPQ
jgi:hypothetical protein